ncbi:MAG: hypothetical protein AAFP86_00470, partial [Planctomycetota bacterium]
PAPGRSTKPKGRRRPRPPRLPRLPRAALGALASLESLRVREVRVERPPRLTPFAFPLFAERVRERVSSESWEDRVRAMAAKLEDGAAAR